MGRVLRKKATKGNCENVSPKPLGQKLNVNVLDSSNKPIKSVLCDRTNINVKNVANVTSEKTVKFSGSTQNQNVKSTLKTSNSIHNNCSDSSVLLKSVKNHCLKSPRVLLSPIKLSEDGKVDLEYINLKSNLQTGKRPQRQNRKILSSHKEIIIKKPIFNEEDGFLGFDKVEKSPLLDILKKEIDACSGFSGFDRAQKSPLLDILRKKIESCCDVVQPLNTHNKKNHLPVYRLNKPSPPKMCSNNIDDRLHMYDFEIDENEPVVKKGKRKPILKIKRCRTYNRKKKFIPTSLQLNDSNQENVCPNVPSNKEIQRNQEIILPNVQANNDPQTKGYTPMSPISERSIPDVFNNSIENTLDTSIGHPQSNVQNALHSSLPCHSSKRESPHVPIIRTSVSQYNDDNCSKSLNASVSSNRHDISVNSAYTAQFASPLYIGSSTPIHRHWADQSNNVYSNATSIPSENFDVSNNFGFNDVDLVEEPIVSPIKGFQTPVRPVTPKKPSPVKIPHRQVIRMLKFGPDAPLNTSLEDESLPIDELLPPQFFHDADTPTFSLTSSPVMPVVRKKGAKNNRTQPIKKKVVIVEDLDDSDFATQSSEDRTSVEEDFRSERTLRNNRTPFQKSNNNQTLSKSMNSNQTVRKTRRNACKDDSDIEMDKGYETEISPVKQNASTRKGRRSYERPAYLRSKKYDDKEEEKEHEEEVEVIVKEKAQPKKRNALSKKEEQELEKWAKAFNEQCMQVENFDLVVE